MASDIQSPAPFVLSPNNDQLERAQVRAARAAANRWKAARVTGCPSPPDDPCLSDEQVAELFQRCIKLAGENKINQKNSWELKLIDHLSDIIKAEAGNSETNFQKASCTLEAGVKIYSVRVDSVHAEAYKVMGRINRAGLEDEQEITMEAGNVSAGKDKSRCKKEMERTVSPLSTLESSFEALNLKKFDVAFMVDPLYHQTSAQFDEGGAKGLLLNNLGVYGRCQVLFDSSEVPGKCRSCPLKNNSLNLIDLSFEKESIQEMVMNMVGQNEISPTLNEILCHIDKDNQRSAQSFNISKNSDFPTDALNDNEVGFDFSSGSYSTMTIDHDEDINFSHEDVTLEQSYQCPQEDNNWHTSLEADKDDRFEEVSAFLFQGLAIASKKNAWAGPDHWKYWRPKGAEDAPATPCRPTNKRSYKDHTEVDLVFTSSIDKDFPDIFCPPKSLKSLLLAANRVPSHRLTEDCHYPPDDLVKLFLLPNVLLLGKRRRNCTGISFFPSGGSIFIFRDMMCDYFDGLYDNLWEQRNNFDEGLPSWGNDCNKSVAGDQYDDGCAHSSVEDLDTLVTQPRQVNRVEVQYDRTSKRIDLHAVKNTLWDQLQEFVKDPELRLKDGISFKGILSSFPVNCEAAMAEDISPHLCFICLLHLANEHGLTIHDFPSLDDLSIHLPSCLNSSD